MPEPVVFRPRGGQILAWTAIGVCAAGLMFMVVTDGAVSLVEWGWPIVLVAWFAWLLYIRPAVTVSDGFVEIANPFRTHRVPWGDIVDVESRYALTLVTTGGRTIRAWAAPAPGARQALATRKEELPGAGSGDGTRRPSDAQGTESGDAAALVRTHLESHRTGDLEVGGTVTSLNTALVVTTAVLTAAAVLTLTVPHG